MCSRKITATLTRVSREDTAARPLRRHISPLGNRVLRTAPLHPHPSMLNMALLHTVRQLVSSMVLHHMRRQQLSMAHHTAALLQPNRPRAMATIALCSRDNITVSRDRTS